MLRITLMDESTQELSRDGILGVFPCTGLFRHPQLKSDAVIYQNGRLLPVLGPLPAAGASAWLLLFETHAQVIKSLPEFDDDVVESDNVVSLESDSDLLLKSA